MKIKRRLTLVYVIITFLLKLFKVLTMYVLTIFNCTNDGPRLYEQFDVKKYFHK